MVKSVTILITLINLVLSPAPIKQEKSDYIGTFVATEYCQMCNSPRGSKLTASGRFVPGYSVATSEIPLGAIIKVKGVRYRVDDTGCPKGRIDFLKEGNVCRCNRNEKIKVFKVKTKGKKNNEKKSVRYRGIALLREQRFYKSLRSTCNIGNRSNIK